jgi:hypothetical protein
MFASIFVTVKSVQSEAKKGFHIADLIQNKVFSTLILSMLSTYVLWFVVSFLFFDPWHMFTSFIQYLLLTPTYINILNVYAFCNTHDLSWGTKGDSTAPGGGSAKSGENSKFKIIVPHPDIQYEKELAMLQDVAPEETTNVNAEDEKKFYYASVRSGIVMAWIFSNLALCGVVLTAGSVGVITKSKLSVEQAQAKNSALYLFIVLWSVAGLSGFRFIGAMWFLVHRKVSFFGDLIFIHWVLWNADKFHSLRGSDLKMAVIVLSYQRTYAFLWSPGRSWRKFVHTISHISGIYMTSRMENLLSIIAELKDGSDIIIYLLQQRLMKNHRRTTSKTILYVLLLNLFNFILTKYNTSLSLNV